jgi:delta-aminolevulinic acid dehydratase/porphobilinogen synthase
MHPLIFTSYHLSSHYSMVGAKADQDWIDIESNYIDRTNHLVDTFK